MSDHQGQPTSRDDHNHKLSHWRTVISNTVFGTFIPSERHNANNSQRRQAHSNNNKQANNQKTALTKASTGLHGSQNVSRRRIKFNWYVRDNRPVNTNRLVRCRSFWGNFPECGWGVRKGRGGVTAVAQALTAAAWADWSWQAARDGLLCSLDNLAEFKLRKWWTKGNYRFF